MEKRFIAADDLLTDSFRLAASIAEDDFRPDFLVGLWRGGSAVGIAVQEGLEQFGIPTDHIAVRTSYRGAASYADMVNRANEIRVHGLEYLVDNVSSRHKLLIVDDVYSTGSSVAAVIQQLSRKTRRNLPGDIRTASVWFRETERTLRAPDYYMHKTHDWLVLPYELSGLSIGELRAARPDLGDIIDRLERQMEQRSQGD
ncbi:MAG: phosphoribosyltransferase family protein [Woeseiaceae bacterium]|nr:phosphoribosyltransferase family protein [Woeseiaceae bacterium]